MTDINKEISTIKSREKIQRGYCSNIRSLRVQEKLKESKSDKKIQKMKNRKKSKKTQRQNSQLNNPKLNSGNNIKKKLFYSRRNSLYHSNRNIMDRKKEKVTSITLKKIPDEEELKKRFFKDNMRNYTRIMGKTKQYEVLRKRFSNKISRKKKKFLWIISDKCYKNKRILKKILDFLDSSSLLNFMSYIEEVHRKEHKSRRLVKNRINLMIMKVRDVG